LQVNSLLKFITTVFIGLIISISAYTAKSDSGTSGAENKICEKYGWSEVEYLVQPYLSDVLYAALVMQGQSADYRASAAAEQALEKQMPENVKKILRAIIAANC